MNRAFFGPYTDHVRRTNYGDIVVSKNLRTLDLEDSIIPKLFTQRSGNISDRGFFKRTKNGLLICDGAKALTIEDVGGFADALNKIGCSVPSEPPVDYKDLRFYPNPDLRYVRDVCGELLIFYHDKSVRLDITNYNKIEMLTRKGRSWLNKEGSGCYYRDNKVLIVHDCNRGVAVDPNWFDRALEPILDELTCQAYCNELAWVEEVV